MDGRHDLHAALEQSDGGADRGLVVEVAHLLIGQRNEAAAVVDQRTEQLRQRRRRLLVRQRNQSVPQVHTRSVDLAPFAGLDRAVIIANADALGLEARRQVRKGARIDELAQDRGGRPAEAADHVHKAEAVETKARQELVMHEVLTLALQRIVGAVVALDRQDFVGVLVYRDDVRQLEACCLTVESDVFKTLKLQLGVELKKSPDVVGEAFRASVDLVNLLLDEVCGVRGVAFAQIDVAIRP